MGVELAYEQLASGVGLWKPTDDLLHNPDVFPQAEPCEVVYLGLPLGECGGVRMANKVIELASIRGDGAVFGNHQPTHGADATARSEAMGARFGVAPEEVPKGSWYAISAHGAPPDVEQRARARGLKVLNATCPLVERTYVGIREAVGPNVHVAYISFGGPDHPELVGARGVAEAQEPPTPFTVISNELDVDRLLEEIEPDTILSIVGQTTNNSDQADALARYLRQKAQERGINMGRKELQDVCHTVRDRQRSTREIVTAHRVGTLIVVGSVRSKNTASLTKVAAEAAIATRQQLTIYLANSWGQLPDITGRVGVVSGASTLEQNVWGVVDRLAPVNGVVEVGQDTDRYISFRPIDTDTKRFLASAGQVTKPPNNAL